MQESPLKPFIDFIQMRGFQALKSAFRKEIERLKNDDFLIVRAIEEDEIYQITTVHDQFEGQKELAQHSWKEDFYEKLDRRLREVYTSVIEIFTSGISKLTTEEERQNYLDSSNLVVNSLFRWVEGNSVCKYPAVYKILLDLKAELGRIVGDMNTSYVDAEKRPDIKSKKPQKFEELFQSRADMEQVIGVMTKLQIIDGQGQSLLTGRKKSKMTAVIDALVEKKKIPDLAKKKLGALFCEQFGLEVEPSGRVFNNPNTKIYRETKQEVLSYFQ